MDTVSIFVIPIVVLVVLGIGLIKLRARARQSRALAERARNLELLFGAVMVGYFVYRGVSKIIDGYSLVPIPFFVSAIFLVIIMLKR